jgi:hypothetical protein
VILTTTSWEVNRLNLKSHAVDTARELYFKNLFCIGQTAASNASFEVKKKIGSISIARRRVKLINLFKVIAEIGYGMFQKQFVTVL